MYVWGKKVGLVVLGFILSKVVNEILYQLLETDGVSLVRGFVPALFGSAVLVYFCYLAYKVK